MPDFTENVNKRNSIVKVEIFSSPTCKYCPQAVEIVKKVSSEFNGKVEVREVDITSIAGFHKVLDYDILSVPTIAVNGKVKFVGVPREEDVRKALKDALVRLDN
jgi:small redox-active disulfide protein 1